MALLEVLLETGDRPIAVFADPTLHSGRQEGWPTSLCAPRLRSLRLFQLLHDSRAEFLMTYDEAPEIVDLIRRHGFHAVRVLMKNGHHNRIPELVVTPKPVFA